MRIDWATGFFFIAGHVELGFIIKDINFISKRCFAVLWVLLEFFKFILVALIAFDKNLISSFELLTYFFEYFPAFLFRLEIDHVFGEASSGELKFNFKPLNFFIL
jgi:hypothetical protein